MLIKATKLYVEGKEIEEIFFLPFCVLCALLCVNAVKMASSSISSSKLSKTFQRTPLPDEVSHFTHFLLAQLRWQHGLKVGSFDDFDKECLNHDANLGSGDIIAMQPMMEAFFSRHAKGDKWVPFHAVLGDHELYIFTSIWKLHYLTEAEKYTLGIVLLCLFLEHDS